MYWTVIRRMQEKGFWCVKFSRKNYGDVLCVNRRLEPLSLFQRSIIVLIHKYGRGLARMWRRTMAALEAAQPGDTLA